VHERDRDGAKALRVRRGEVALHRRLVERRYHVAAGAHAFVHLHDFLVEQLRKPDVAVEDARPVLVGDAKLVAEAARDEEDRALALALEERVGGDGGAHLHRLDLLHRDGLALGNIEQVADARDGGVAIAPGIFRQELVRGEAAVGLARDDVGERAAAVDPELPARAHRVSSSARASGPALADHSSIAPRALSRRRVRSAGVHGGVDGHAVLAHARVVLREAPFERPPLPGLGPGRRLLDRRARVVVERLPAREIHRREAERNRVVDLREARQVLPELASRAAVARGEDRVDVARRQLRRQVGEGNDRSARAQALEDLGARRIVGTDAKARDRLDRIGGRLRPQARGRPRRRVEQLLSVAREGCFVCGLRSLVEGARLRRVGSDERQRRQREDRFLVAQRAAEAVGHGDTVLAHGLQLLARFVAHLRVGHGDDRDAPLGRIGDEPGEEHIALARQRRRGIFVGEDPLLAVLVCGSKKREERGEGSRGKEACAVHGIIILPY
jgi:hypothetical protein